MAKRNALMEWLDQTKKLAKAQDYAALDSIDKIFDCIGFLKPKVLTKHAAILNDICQRYHKDNPLDSIFKRRKTDRIFADRNGQGLQAHVRQRLDRAKVPADCPAKHKWRTCTISQIAIDILGAYVDGSLARLEKLKESIDWQWFEIIDFMWEWPELINPNSIDEYVREQITAICVKWRKKNPLKDRIRLKFGKSWRDSGGHWRPERRKRF